MGVGTDPDLRTREIIALAACRTLLDSLDPDDPDQLDLIDHLDEVCIAIEGDLERNSG